jgi:hypothetical protein
MGQDIYYTVMKDIQPGEQLKVWYAPYYAVKMGAVPFNIDLTADVSTYVNTLIFVVTTIRVFNPFAHTHGRDTCELARSVVYTHGCETG